MTKKTSGKAPAQGHGPRTVPVGKTRAVPVGKTRAVPVGKKARTSPPKAKQKSTAEPPDPARPDPTRPDPTRPDPTRYGDWEKKGRCSDF